MANSDSNVEANQTLENMIAGVRGIGASSDKLASCAIAVNEIAFQLSMLALNADAGGGGFIEKRLPKPDSSRVIDSSTPRAISEWDRPFESVQPSQSRLRVGCQTAQFNKAMFFAGGGAGIDIKYASRSATSESGNTFAVYGGI